MKQNGLKKNFVHTIQQKIFSGEYAIGQQLPTERELAAQLGVSRSLVNTGVLELASQGFVRILPRQGTVVADYKRNGTLQVLAALMNCDSYRIDYPLLKDLIELRILVECESARLASRCITAEELSALSAEIRAMQACNPPENAAKPMLRFHYLLTQYSGNAVYAMTFKSFESTILRLMRQHLQTMPDLPKTVKQHESLVRALEARNPEESAACTRTCILQGVKALKKLYEQG
ncbi:MAG: FCD domain-containing protein [Christensenella sp.]|nr:FCD domain-containing protein [Christensenella sp.]